MTDKSLIEFPTHFPIKVFGPDNKSYIEEIYHIVKSHFPDTGDECFVHKSSSQQKWISITVTIYVESQKELDMLYINLGKHPLTKMVL